MIIVTGAAGLIGTYLIDRLIGDGYEVIGVDIDDIGEAYYKERNIPFIHLDITKKGEFAKLPQKGVDSFVNLACLQPANVKEEDYDPRDYIIVNVLGVLNILDFCRKTRIQKVIHTISHRNVQGLWENGQVIREDAANAIKYTGEYTMYSISESAAVDCVKYYGKQYGMQGIIFRLPPVYAYGPHTEGFKNGKYVKTGFQVFLENAIAGKSIELWGDCEKGRDIIYVKDVVSAIILAIKSKDVIGLYNITSGKLLSLREEVEEIIRAFSPIERPSQIILCPDKPNSIEPFLYDISKARRDLGWYPKYTFPEMLVDFKKEMESGKFKFLQEKRRHMMM